MEVGSRREAGGEACLADRVPLSFLIFVAIGSMGPAEPAGRLPNSPELFLARALPVSLAAIMLPGLGLESFIAQGDCWLLLPTARPRAGRWGPPAEPPAERRAAAAR